jgi:hypothetical protein
LSDEDNPFDQLSDRVDDKEGDPFEQLDDITDQSRTDSAETDEDQTDVRDERREPLQKEGEESPGAKQSEAVTDSGSDERPPAVEGADTESDTSPNNGSTDGRSQQRGDTRGEHEEGTHGGETSDDPDTDGDRRETGTGFTALSGPDTNPFGDGPRKTGRPENEQTVFEVSQRGGDDPFVDITEREGDPFASVDDAFEEVDVGDLDPDSVWEELSSAEIEAVAEKQGRTYAEVSKHSYCEQCEYFSDPPDVGCTHEGTQIVEFLDVETVRLVDCPVVAERKRLQERD